MGKDLHKEMKESGVDLGAKIDLVLKEGARFNLKTTIVPTYHAPTEDNNRPSTIVFTGFVAEFTDDYIGLLPCWDTRLRQNPEFGRIGGVRFDYGAIHSYRSY